MTAIPQWIEWVVAVLAVASGLLALMAAVGIVRLQNFFLRLHPPALASTVGVWSMALAALLFLSFTGGELALKAWIIPVVMSITAPVTATLLSRAALFRQRLLGGDVPPPLGHGLRAGGNGDLSPPPAPAPGDRGPANPR